MSAKRFEISRRKADVVLRSAAVLAITAAMTWLPTAPASAAAAQRVILALTYTCAFPVIGNQSTSVNVSSDIPDSIPVGQSTAHYVVTATVTVPWELTAGMRTLGVRTVAGTADGVADVQAPQGNLTAAVPFTIPKITGANPTTSAATTSPTVRG